MLMANSDGKPFKVLFCDTAFPYGAIYTSEQLKGDPDVEVISCDKAELAAYIKEADVAVPLGARLTSDLIQGSRLKLIIQYGVGLEGVDIAAATVNGTWVSNIPSDATGNAASCAEHAIYLALALLRDQHAMAAALRERRLGQPLGQTLLGRTVLIIGFGNIAAELIPRLKPFEVRLVCVRRSSWEGVSSPAAQLLDARAQWEQVHKWLPEADIIFLTCTQNETTHGMVNKEFLESCKSGVLIVNVARGGLLQYDAVREALAAGEIGGLGLDVQWSEPFDPEDYFASHPRVVLTPHIAGVTELSYRAMGKATAEAVRLARRGEPPLRRFNNISAPGP